DHLNELDLDFSDPEALLLKSVDSQLVRHAIEELPIKFREVVVLREIEGLSYKEIANIVDIAIEALPIEFREVVVLREIEGLSYKEIANVVDIPIGTVMSRLKRGRERLHALLATRMGKEANIELRRNAGVGSRLCRG